MTDLQGKTRVSRHKLAKEHDICGVKKPELTVVLIHGIASDALTFNNLLHNLSGREALREVRFVTFDLLGAGKSKSSDVLEYDYAEQIQALEHAISELDAETPLVLLGHSMGTLIVTKYATEHPEAAKHLILVSPPVYTKNDLENPLFKQAIEVFEKAVSVKNREIVSGKAFQNSMKNIVMNPDNYERLSSLTTPATLIYGIQDQIIGVQNFPRLLKENAKHLELITTAGAHGVTQEKFAKIAASIEKTLKEVKDEAI